MVLKIILRKILLFLFTNKLNKVSNSYYRNLSKDNAKYIEFPFIENIYIQSTTIGLYIFYVLTLIAIIMTLFGLLVVPIETSEDKNQLLAIIICDIVLILATLGMRLMNLYYLFTRTLFYDDHVVIKRFGCKDKVVNYEEISESVQKRGIRLRKGCMELPYKGGKTKIVINEKDTSDELFKFLNQKCHLNMPILTQSEKAIVRRTGIMPIFIKIASALFLLDLLFFGIGFNIDNRPMMFWRYYVSSFTNDRVCAHFSIAIGGVLFLLGIILGMKNAIPLHVQFAKNKIYKVK